jgi:hypothetical protein
LAYSVKPGGHIWFEFSLKQEGMGKSADMTVGFSVRVSIRMDAELVMDAEWVLYELVLY